MERSSKNELLPADTVKNRTERKLKQLFLNNSPNENAEMFFWILQKFQSGCLKAIQVDLTGLGEDGSLLRIVKKIFIPTQNTEGS